jgi:Nif-specific regulatory protein
VGAMRDTVGLALGESHLDRSSRSLLGIYEISKILCGPGDLRHLLSSSLAVLHSFLDMGNGVVALLEENGDPELVVSGSFDTATAREYFAVLPERVIGQIVVSGMPVLVDDVSNDTNFAPWDTRLWEPTAGSWSFIGVPIRDRDRVIGVMAIDRGWVSTHDLRPDDDVRFVKMAANLIGQTVRLHHLVMRDRERLLADQRRMEKEREQLVRARTPGGTRIIGESPALRTALDQVQRIARSNAAVLLRGESGTGKELFAQVIHEASSRRAGPFVKLNCAALPETVLESELFGHEKGAFTGAIAMRKGRFELADGGTLFLDEIGEISASFQAKLLRVLQEGEFERVGGSRTLKVSVRLVSATNRNLEEAVAKGTFRADLYYRIAVVHLQLPALRDRQGDIPLLAREFLDRFNHDNQTHLTLSNSTLAVMQTCFFPGNVRELENCVRRTATMARGNSLEERDLSCRNDGCLSSVLWQSVPQNTRGDGGRLPGFPSPVPFVGVPLPVLPKAAASAPASQPEPSFRLPVDGDRSEREALIDAMEKTGWVQAKAARLMNLTPRQIGYALRKYDIPIKKF